MSTEAPVPGDVLDTGAAGPAAVRGSLVRIAGYAIVVLLSVGSASLLFRHLGVVRSGQYVIVVSLIGIAQGLTDVGISALGVREMSVRDAPARAALMRALLGLRLVMTFLGVGFAVLFAVLAGYDGAMVLGTVVAGAGLLVQNIQSTLAIDLHRQLRYTAVTAADVLRQLVTVAAIIALVVLGADLLPFFVAAVLGALAGLALTVALVRTGGVPLRPAFDRSTWGPLLRDTLPFVAATAVYALYFRIAIVLVSLLVDELQAGYFAAAFRIVEVLLILPALAVGSAFPIFARAARDDLERLAYGVSRTFQAAVLFGAWLALALCFAAPLAIDIVAGAEYEPAVPVLRIESVALGASFVTQTFGFALLSLHRHRALLLVHCSALVATAALTAVLTTTAGIEGAAWALTVGEVALAVLTGIALLRVLPGAVEGAGGALKVAVATAAAAGAAVLAGGPAVLQAVVATVVFWLLAFALRAVPAELTEPLRARRSR